MKKSFHYWCLVCEEHFMIDETSQNTIIKPIKCPNCGNTEDESPIELLEVIV